MGLAGSAARGAATTLLGQWSKFAVQLASTAILARLLSAEDFGIFAMVLVFSGFAALLSEFGFALASMQSQTATPAQRSNLLWLGIGVGVAAGICLFLAAEPISWVYSNEDVANVTRAMSVAFVIQAIQSQFRAESARNLRYKRLALADVVAQAIGLGAAVFLATQGGGYWALVLQQLVFSMVQASIVILSARWVPRLPSRSGGMGALVGFGARAGAVQVLSYLSSNVDTLALGRAWGASVTGVYSQAFLLFRIPLLQIASPMTQVAVPILSRIADPRQFAMYVARAQTVLVYVLGGGFLLAGAVAYSLIDLVLGSKWSDAAPIVMVLSVGGVFQALGYVYYWVFLARNLTGIQLRVSLISRPAMIVTILAGLPWGGVGVAVGGSVGLFLNWLLLSIYALPKTGLDAKKVITGGIAPLLALVPIAIATALVGWWLHGHVVAWLLLLIQLSVAALLLTVMFLVVGRVRKDVLVILDTIRRIRA